MTILIIICAVATLATIILIAIEPRRLFNGLAFLATAGLWLIYIFFYALSHQHSIAAWILIGLVILFPIVYFVIAIYLLSGGIKMIKREGASLSHNLGLFVGIFLLFWPILMSPFIKLFKFEIGTILLFIMSVVGFMILMLLAVFFFYSIIYCIMPKGRDCDFIIIHGAGLMPDGKVTPLLRQRIDKAVKLWEKYDKKPMLVASGGQGGDEICSEASAIRGYLNYLGISDDHILLEDKSTTTYENLVYSKALLDKRCNNYKSILVTNSYHVMRAALYSKQLGMNAQGVGCHTAGYFLPSAFLREYIAVLKMNLKPFLILCAVFTVIPLILFYIIL